MRFRKFARYILPLAPRRPGSHYLHERQTLGRGEDRLSRLHDERRVAGGFVQGAEGGPLRLTHGAKSHPAGAWQKRRCYCAVGMVGIIGGGITTVATSSCTFNGT